MIQITGCLVAASTLLAGTVLAQDDIPLLRPEEREVVDAQSQQVSQIIEPVLEAAGESTVRIWRGTARLAYGTVIGDGDRVLTKWSQLDGGRREGQLVVESSEGKVIPVALVGVYGREDLAVLKLEGVTKLKPVSWADHPMQLGAFLAATQPGGRLAGFGVMSVQERNLREMDKAYLGLISEIGFDGMGVKIKHVTEASAAAVAGLKAGDVITSIAGREVSGLMELQNVLAGESPGNSVRTTYLRDGKNETVDVILGKRPKFPNYLGQRLETMEQMGTRISRVRDSFPSAIQTDMALEPNQVGGPVCDLNGRVVGITLARADRTRSFIMSSRTVKELLDQEMQDPVLAKAQIEQELAEAMEEARRQYPSDAPAANPPREQGKVNPRQLNHHLGEMRRLMQLMRREMEMLEER